MRRHNIEVIPEPFPHAVVRDFLDFDAVAADIDAVMTDSKEWWPADWGNYGP